MDPRNTDPRPTTYAEWEDLEEKCDRLAAELLAAREELGRVRRNHLRRMASQDTDTRRRASNYAMNRGATWPDKRIHAINRRFNRFFDAVYIALYHPTTDRSETP